MRTNVLVRVCEPPVDRVHHKRDQDLALVLRQESLDERVWDAGEPERVDEGECRGDLAAVLIKRVQELGQVCREHAFLHVHLEMPWQWDRSDEAVEVRDTIIPLLHEVEHEFPGQVRAMCSGRVEGDDRGAGLPARVLTGARKPVDIDDPLVVRTEDREPRIASICEGFGASPTCGAL